MRYVFRPGQSTADPRSMTHLPVGLKAWTRYLESAIYNACQGRHKVAHQRMRQAAVAGGLR